MESTSTKTAILIFCSFLSFFLVKSETFYQTIGVSQSASSEEINRKCREGYLRHHPDKGGSNEKFRILWEACQQLQNKEKRAQYDRKLAREARNNQQKTQPNNMPHKENNKANHKKESKKTDRKKAPSKTESSNAQAKPKAQPQPKTKVVEFWNKTDTPVSYRLIPHDNSGQWINLAPGKYHTHRVTDAPNIITKLVFYAGPQQQISAYEFAPGKNIIVRLKEERKYIFGPQTGPLMGLLGRTERGYDKNAAVTSRDIYRSTP